MPRVGIPRKEYRRPEDENSSKSCFRLSTATSHRRAPNRRIACFLQYPLLLITFSDSVVDFASRPEPSWDFVSQLHLNLRGLRVSSIVSLSSHQQVVVNSHFTGIRILTSIFQFLLSVRPILLFFLSFVVVFRRPSAVSGVVSAAIVIATSVSSTYLCIIAYFITHYEIFA